MPTTGSNTGTVCPPRTFLRSWVAAGSYNRGKVARLVEDARKLVQLSIPSCGVWLSSRRRATGLSCLLTVPGNQTSHPNSLVGSHLRRSQVQGHVDLRLPANVPSVRLVLPSSFLTSILDTHAPLDSPCTPDSVDLPLPTAIPRRKIYSTSCAGVPLSLVRRGLAPGTRETLVMVPGNLQQAKEMMSRFPPAPPGRNLVEPAVKSKRQCHGCHGYIDDHHASIPVGVDRCTRDHDERCLGGIIGGTDGKGRLWRPCPPGYINQPTENNYIDEDNSEDDYDDIEDKEYLEELNNDVFKSPPGNLLGIEVSQAVTTSSSCTAGSTVVSGAGSLSSHCNTTAS